MHGGPGHWKFYLTEVDRIESEHQRQLPESKYTVEEIQAGLDKLAKAYGTYSTLVFMEEKTGRTSEELEQWSLNKYLYRMRYYAWQGFYQKRYSDIMSKPKKRK